jgi:hypothetical protein
MVCNSPAKQTFLNIVFSLRNLVSSSQQQYATMISQKLPNSFVFPSYISV